MKEFEQSAKSRSAADDACGKIVVGRGTRRSNELGAEPLVGVFCVVARDEVANQDTKVPFAEDDEVSKTLAADGPYQSRSDISSLSGGTAPS